MNLLNNIKFHWVSKHLKIRKSEYIQSFNYDQFTIHEITYKYICKYNKHININMLQESIENIRNFLYMRHPTNNSSWHIQAEIKINDNWLNIGEKIPIIDPEERFYPSIQTLLEKLPKGTKCIVYKLNCEIDN